MLPTRPKSPSGMNGTKNDPRVAARLRKACWDALGAIPPIRRIGNAMLALSLLATACTAGRALNSGKQAGVGTSPSPSKSQKPLLSGDVYAGINAGLNSRVSGIKPRVYVPNSSADSVDVIDPTTYQVIDHFPVGNVPHHITPSWDMSKLYVDNTGSSSLTEIDPSSGKPVENIPVPDPYNLYFTPDGSKAVVVAERFRRLDFRDPSTWKLIKSLPIIEAGADHLDFSADGSYLMVSTEFSGLVIKVDLQTMTESGEVSVGGLPVDVRLSADGSVFFVANQGRHGVSVVDPLQLKEIAFIPTGLGAHGLVVSRDAKHLFVSNRREGTISVIDMAHRSVTATWRVGGSPDMMQVSPDGKELWFSNRFNATVSVVSTETGSVLHKIPVGLSAHGLTYFPQPGRFSIGHNGIYR